MRTQSELWFEQFCSERLLPLGRIPEEVTRTPDYELELPGQQTVIVEVKEILPNKDELASIEKMRRDGVGLVNSGKPGQRARGKISDASAQIKARTDGRLPSLLVLCDIKHGCGQITGHLDPYSIRVAMEGLDEVIIAVPRDYSKSPYAVRMKSGPYKKMTKNQNTSISAIGVLYTPSEREVLMDVYHNQHAAIPLDAAILHKYGIPQYRLSGVTGEPSEWIRT